MSSLKLVRPGRLGHWRSKGIKKAPSFVFILAEACTLTSPMLLLLVQ